MQVNDPVTLDKCFPRRGRLMDTVGSESRKY